MANEFMAMAKASVAASNAAAQALNAAVQAQICANKAEELGKGIRAQLDEIKAKKQLKIRLTAKERAVWTLYGD